jgi:predicted DNA-binding transcriptional regulator AlpA
MSLEHAPRGKGCYRPETSDWAKTQISQLPPDIPRVLRIPETCHITGLSAQQIWALEQEKRFPARFKLSPDAPKNGACGHDYHEVMDWLEERRASREKASA